MHFFYIDESGDTGQDLLNAQQPIFVMGGLSLSDEKWNNTQQAYSEIINQYFGGHVPSNFELHAHELLSPAGDGAFNGHSRQQRNDLALAILDILRQNKHNAHLIAFHKATINQNQCNALLAFNATEPYLLGFDYLITQINDHVRTNLGSSARGLIILDKKEAHHENIERILHDRRFQTTATHRVKRVVEFSYPIDSQKNPMIQISDLIVFTTRKFLEVEHGFGANWPQDAKNFFAKCYDIIDSRLTTKGLVDRGEPKLAVLNNYLAQVRAKPVGQWRKKYTI